MIRHFAILATIIVCVQHTGLSRADAQESELLKSLRDPQANRLRQLDKAFTDALGLEDDASNRTSEFQVRQPSSANSTDPESPNRLPSDQDTLPRDDTEPEYKPGQPVAPPEYTEDPSLFLSPTVDARNEMLRGFVESALANSPELCVARARVCALQGKWLQVGLMPNPTLGLSAQEIGNDGSAGQWGLQYNRQIPRGNKLGLNRAIVNQEIKQQRIQLGIDSARLRNDVELAFFQAVTAAHRAYVTSQMAQMAEETLKRVQKALAAEEATRADLLQAELDLEAAKMSTEAAGDSHQSAMRRLAALLCFLDDELQPLLGDAVGALPNFPWEATLCEMMQNSPALHRQRHAIQQAKRNVDRQYAEQIPDLNVGVTVAYDDDSNDPFASFNIGRPILTRNDNRGAIQKAKAEVTQQSCQLHVIEQRSREKLAAAIRNYEMQRKKLHWYTTSVLPKAAEHLELVRRAAFEGEESFATYHTAQREYAKYYEDFFDVLEQSWRAHWQVRNLLDGVTEI